MSLLSLPKYLNKIWQQRRLSIQPRSADLDLLIDHNFSRSSDDPEAGGDTVFLS